ncbi:hypothetical protein [Paenibacillus pinistramenti]|uniref:hypothetical protein n=1 Tax=Paenibacillus pinistramenti TaxID=1768003 RepID=UPI00193963EA|nr:hypothetical protein [Paenibacillus pinistramenti]
MQKGLKLQGSVFAAEGDLDSDDFWDKFIDFLEENGWEFGGSSHPINEEGNRIKDNPS